LEQLQDVLSRANLFSRMWRTLSFVVTFGLWRPGAALEEDRDREELRRQFYELYAADILRRADRDSLAGMIDRISRIAHGDLRISVSA
jgi:hypothetical protein